MASSARALSRWTTFSAELSRLEKPIPGVSGASLAQGIRQVSRTDVTFLPDFDAIAEALRDELRPGDVLVTQGAGSVTNVGPRVLANMD